MANVSELKKIVSTFEQVEQPSGPGLLEVFCVDTSISMGRSQSFPYIFGESKLSVCRRIILEPLKVPEDCAFRRTALVKFHHSQELAVPFAPHDEEQIERFKKNLVLGELQKGSTIYSSYAFCEKLVSDYQQEHGLTDSKVLIHLFSDGLDNGSSIEDINRYQNYVGEFEVGMKQSFLYSFDSNFETSQALAKSLHANLIVVEDDQVHKALEERDKWLLKFFSKPKKTLKNSQGFNLAKGYTPELSNIYSVIKKVYRFFSSGDYASQEGLFRVSASIPESKRLASDLLTETEHLNDFEDSLLVAHALKTALSNSPPILPSNFQTSLIEISAHAGDNANILAECKSKIGELPLLNRDCLRMLFSLLHLVAKESSKNKMTSANLAMVFTFLLFPDLQTPIPSLQNLMVLLIDHCEQVFEQQKDSIIKNQNSTQQINSNTASNTHHKIHNQHHNIKNDNGHQVDQKNNNKAKNEDEKNNNDNNDNIDKHNIATKLSNIVVEQHSKLLPKLDSVDVTPSSSSCSDSNPTRSMSSSLTRPVPPHLRTNSLSNLNSTNRIDHSGNHQQSDHQSHVINHESNQTSVVVNDASLLIRSASKTLPPSYALPPIPSHPKTQHIISPRTQQHNEETKSTCPIAFPPPETPKS